MNSNKSFDFEEWEVVEPLEVLVRKLENENMVLKNIIIELNKKLELKNNSQKNNKYKSSNGF